MDSLGLPTAFGKSRSQSHSASNPSNDDGPSTASLLYTSTSTSFNEDRGGSRGRGPRGVVGGGKRGRSQRGGGVYAPQDYNGNGWPAQRDVQVGTTSRLLNEGIKRPRPSTDRSMEGGHDNVSGLGYDQRSMAMGEPIQSDDRRGGFGGSRGGRGGPGNGNGFGRGRGGRGGGHNAGGVGGYRRGGGQGDEATEKGFFKESFCEDPWRDLEK